MTATVPPIGHDDRAASSSASWKFDFLDTVNADPACTPACLKVIKVYLNFASEAVPTAFVATSELCLRTNLSRPTIIRAREKLKSLGYMVPRGTVGDGAIQYRLVNARKLQIDDHLVIGREKLKEDCRLQRQYERAREKSGCKKMIPPKMAWGYQNLTPVCKEMIPNTLEEYPRGSSYEAGENLIGLHGFYSEAKGDDPKAPFPIPETEDQAEDMLRQIVCDRDVADYVVNAMGLMLRKGTLSPANAESLINQYREVAA